jgi:C4-dicarboxylate transporter, DctM subunit
VGHLLVLGMFLDGLSTMLLTVPLMAPVVVGLGFEGVWFGVLVLKAIEIGLITPPVGINAFIISGITKVPVWDVFKRLVPFVLLDVAVTALFFVFPEIVLWMPRAAGLLP